MPVIMFSARAGKETIAEGLAEGADDYLIKPFTARELLTRVASLLRLSRLRLKAARTEKMLRMEVHLRHAHTHTRTPHTPHTRTRTTTTNSSHAKLTRPSLLATHVTMQINESKDRLEHILASLKDAFIALDSQQRYTYVNSNAAEMLGARKQRTY